VQDIRPLLSVLIAIAIACVDLYALRRSRGQARLLSIFVVIAPFSSPHAAFNSS